MVNRISLCVVITYCIIIKVHYFSCLTPDEPENKKHGVENQRRLINDLIKDYDTFVAPSDKGPLIVRLQLFILGFSDISELNMDFTLFYFMMLMWRDDRLHFRPENYENISYINLHPVQMHKIWRPDIFFRNEKGESISKPFSLSNSASRIFPSGDVQFIRKLETKFHCQLNFKNYPFDIR